MEAGGEVYQILMFFQITKHLVRRTVAVDRIGEKVQIVEYVAVDLHREIAGGGE